MWHGRFEGGQSDLLRQYSESVSFDRRLYAQDIRGSIAHARALRNAGILSEEEFGLIEAGLRGIGEDIRSGKFEFSTGLEDVHMNIEAELTKRIGPAGAKLHTARSRNDQVATDVRLYLRDALGEIREAILETQRALVELAGRYTDAVLPGYTHLQRAQPVVLAHHLLAYVEMFDRDAGRIEDATRRFNLCPLGSGAIAGSTIVLDREAVARELGFEGVTQNSMDAVADRDFLCETLAALAVTGMHLSRLSEDIILWNSSEFGFLRLADAHTTGSSLMPQKKNPDIAELARGKTGRLYGNLMALLTACKGLPLTYNRDLQEDKEPLFDSIDTVLLTLLLFAEMLRAAGFDTERMADAAADPLLLATDVADLLVLRGVPFRQAHEKVGRLVAESEKTGVPLDELPEAVLREIVPEIAGEFRPVFNPAAALKKRTAPGAPAPERVRERIVFWRGKLRPNSGPE